MKYKIIVFKKILILIIGFFIIQGMLFAQETDTNAAILTMKTFGPIGAGVVDPNGIWIVHKAGDSVAITASPNTGFAFSNWSITGLGTIADENSATTNVDLTGNATVTANFIQSGNTLTADLDVTFSPAGAGSVTPLAPVTLDIGQKQQISAIANGAFKFLKWSVEGPAIIDDIYATTTNATISGPVSIIALFEATANTYEITLSTALSGDGGSISNPGTYYVKKDESMHIQAIPDPGYIFTGWIVNGNASFSNEDDSQTEITPQEDITVSASFKKSICNFNNPRRAIYIRKTHNSTARTKNRDYVNIRFLPMCLRPEYFNPNTDTMKVHIDGNIFTINKANGFFRVNGHGYRYQSFSKHTGSIKLFLDFTKGVWSFIATRVNLDKLDNSDGGDVKLSTNGYFMGNKYDMEETLLWRFNKRIHTSVAIPSNGIAMQSFGITSMKYSTRNTRMNRDYLVISKASVKLPVGTFFDPTNQVVTVNIGAISIIIPKNSFKERNTNNFFYRNRDQGINFKLNLKKGTWSLVYKKCSNWGKLKPGDGLKVFLSIGDNQSGVEIVPAFRQRLKYNYNRFHWQK